MSSAIVLNKGNKQSKALMLASIVVLPFQPMLVTAIHTGIVEVCLHLLHLPCENPVFKTFYVCLYDYPLYIVSYCDLSPWWCVGRICKEGN
jgi:hypothetical protein